MKMVFITLPLILSMFFSLSAFDGSASNIQVVPTLTQTSNNLQTAAANPEITVSVTELQAKENFWKVNKWAGLAGTIILLSGAVYFELEANGHYDSFRESGNLREEIKAWDDYDQALDNRNTAFYISIIPAAYTAFSWFKENSYRRVRQ